VYKFDINSLKLAGDKLLLIEDTPPTSTIIVAGEQKKTKNHTYSAFVHLVGNDATAQVGDRVFFTGDAVEHAGVLMSINNQQYFLLPQGYCIAVLPSNIKDIY